MAAAISHPVCHGLDPIPDKFMRYFWQENLLSLCQPKLIPTLYTMLLCLNIVEQEMFLTLLSFDPHSCASSGESSWEGTSAHNKINPVFIRICTSWDKQPCLMLQCTSRVVLSVNSCHVSLIIMVGNYIYIYFNTGCCSNFRAAISAFSKGLFF